MYLGGGHVNAYTTRSPPAEMLVKKVQCPFVFRVFHRLEAVGVMIEILPHFSGKTTAYFVLHGVSQSFLASLHSSYCFSLMTWVLFQWH